MAQRLTAMALAARRNFQYLDRKCIEGLQDLARGLAPDPVAINIGAGFGTSALALLESRDDIRVVTVEAHEDRTPIGSLKDERDTMLEAGFLGNDRYEQIHGMSIEIGNHWERPQVDLVFVDASHSYEACKGDALAWLPHIKDGGVIVFHDYWDRYDYGVIRAVDEVMVGSKRILTVSCLVAFKVP